LQVKLCDPCLSALNVPPWPKRRYINTLPFLSFPHSMSKFGPLTAEIGSGVWGTQLISMGFASWLRYCSDVAHWSPTKLHDVWPSPALLHYINIFGGLPPDRILPRAKFALRPGLAFSYIGSVTARLTALRQRASAKLCGVVQGMELWNFRRGATYIWLCGHDVRNQPTFEFMCVLLVLS